MKYFAKFAYSHKAREDEYEILEKAGWHSIPLGSDKYKNTIMKNAILFLTKVRLLFKRFANDDILWIQIPDTHHFKTFFYYILLWKKVKLIVSVIDLDKFRNQVYDDSLEKKIFQHAHAVWAHTEMMAKTLFKYDYVKDVKKIFTPHLWAYLTNDEPSSCSNFGLSVAFAGNMEKAPFLKIMGGVNWGNLHFTIYGRQFSINSHNISFDDIRIGNNVSLIKEDWGLVWDGDSIETCEGQYGNYMNMVSSHKVSLYLAANRPLIVWSGSSLAHYVKNHSLGIVIDGLKDIESSIVSLSQEQKEKIKHNVEKWGLSIRTGAIYKDILGRLER